MSELNNIDIPLHTLYVRRDVIPNIDLDRWAHSESIIINNDAHVTIAYSTTPVDWTTINRKTVGEFDLEFATYYVSGDFGKNLMVFELNQDNKILHSRWKYFIEGVGASWDFPNYRPHITLCNRNGKDISKIKPYAGIIRLGPEIIKEVKK